MTTTDTSTVETTTTETTPATPKPTTIVIAVDNGRPRGGIKRPTRPEGRRGRPRRPHGRRRGGAPPRLRHREARDARDAGAHSLHGEPARPVRARAATTRTPCSQSWRCGREPPRRRRARDRGGPGPPGSGVDLLLGRGRRPGRLVRPAGRALAASRSSARTSGAGAARQCSRASSSGRCASWRRCSRWRSSSSSGSSALVGDTDPFRNLAPTWIYVIFWLGLPALTVVFGYVWRGLSPWRAMADAFVWVRKRTGGDPRPLAAYPERLGRWPAAVTLFAFASLELAYSDPASPRALAFAIALYTYVALFGMASFGREHVGGERGGVRGPLPLPRPHRTVPRGRRASPRALASHRARRRPMRSRGRSRSSR